MSRIVLLGTPSSGKTTTAARLARATGLVHHELDRYFWNADGTESELATFRARVTELCRGPAWIIEGHDTKVRDLTWPRATVFVWLSPPLAVVLARAALRSVFRRGACPAKSNLGWALRTHRERTREYAALFSDPRYATTRKLRLRHGWMGADLHPDLAQIALERQH